MLFIRIFDLKIRGYTNFHSSSCVIPFGGKNVTAIPDAVIYKKTSEKEKILAVAEVGKNYSNTKEYVSEKNSRNAGKGVTRIDPIDSNLKGKHVGQMLAYLPKSVFELNGIYGIIVQGTEVTIGSLSVGEEYYNNMKEVSQQNMSSIMKYSRPFNMLIGSEREKLIQTFVDMEALLDILL